MKIGNDVLEVLNNSKLENNVLFLPLQLDRKLYQDVNKVLECLGGKWDRKLKGHKFGDDVESLLNDAINFGEVINQKKELQFYETPPPIIEQLIGLAEIKGTDQVLEPSAGKGAIIKALLKITQSVSAVEIADRKELLTLLGSYIQADFLSLPMFERYDKVVMNPPFSKQQDIDHILHAFKGLKKDGILVAVLSESPFFRNNKKSIEFREWLAKNEAEIIDLEAGAFSTSGTNVKTRIVKIRTKW
ncbi:MAG: methyltransferase [Ignavibacteriales bacterium]|nr:methyltransferase [Ignavibacteriales bacterium]MBK7380799.1 methyltransferase [Ignavibacteriales bacterium]